MATDLGKHVSSPGDADTFFVTCLVFKGFWDCGFGLMSPCLGFAGTVLLFLDREADVCIRSVHLTVAESALKILPLPPRNLESVRLVSTFDNKNVTKKQNEALRLFGNSETKVNAAATQKKKKSLTFGMPVKLIQNIERQLLSLWQHLFTLCTLRVYKADFFTDNHRFEPPYGAPTP